MGVLLWPAVACRSAPLTWGSVRPPAASLCSPADCSGQAERSSQPSQAPRGPGLDLGSLPWQHTVDKCISNGGKLVNSINTPEIIRRGRGGVGVRKWLILTLSFKLQISTTSGKIYCFIVQHDLRPCAHFNWANSIYTKLYLISECASVLLAMVLP